MLAAAFYAHAFPFSPIHCYGMLTNLRVSGRMNNIYQSINRPVFDAARCR
jgi:hypothetical protein